MVMYPHTIIITQPGESVKDVQGNWTLVTGTDVTLECRMETNSGRSFLTGTDGSRIDYAAIVYLQTGTDIKVGGKVIIKKGVDVLQETTIKHFHKGQLNMRLWV